MTDIDILLERARITAGHLAPVVLMPEDAVILVLEVERLRAQQILGSDDLARAYDKGRHTERAAIVAYLRDSKYYRGTEVIEAAKDIERGTHKP